MRALILACLAYAALADSDADQSHWLAGAMGKAAFLGGSVLSASHVPANPSGVAAPQALANPSGAAAPQAPAWHRFREIEENIEKLHVQNAAMKMALEHMVSQAETLDGPAVRAQADAQNRQGPGKVFMGFGAFACGCALMYSIQKLFPSSQTRHGSRAAPLMSMSMPSGAELQQPMRPLHVTINGLALTVYEHADPQSLVERYNCRWEEEKPGGAAPDTSEEPFGVVLWPGAHVAARLLNTTVPVAGRSVLVLGAGTGLEALMAARMGAKRVIACDVNANAMALLRHAATEAGLQHVLQVVYFDLFSTAQLPAADVVVFSDTLYSTELARRVGERCLEALAQPAPPDLIVTDTPKMEGPGSEFLSVLNRGAPSGRAAFEWAYERLEQVTGTSSVADEDVTYDADVRYLLLRGSSASEASHAARN